MARSWKMKAKTRRWIKIALVVCGVVADVALIWSLAVTKKRVRELEVEKLTEIDGSISLNEWVTESTKDLNLSLTENITLTMNESGETFLSTVSTPNLTVNGNGNTVNITGAVKGAIKAAEGGTLTFQNIKFVDNTTGGVYMDYLGFGGNICFENCTFTNSIYLFDDANASFKNCTVKITATERYGVWIADGSANFDSCTFEGTRAIKINEEGADDVEEVSVDKCLFNKISEKPGVVIGEIMTSTTGTAVSVKNSKFIDCYAWDKVGCVEGIDGCYEALTKTDTFNFELKNNTVQFTPSTYNVAYYGIIDGEQGTIPATMYKEGGNYPTTYESAKGAIIDDLQDEGYIEFQGWYFDRACQKPANGTISAGYTGHVELYAKIVDLTNIKYWTPIV